jgi:PAS domain S-box-containing protein
MIQKELIQSESRFRQLIELAQEGIWVLDKDFVTIFVNPKMAEMLGTTQNEMIGKSALDFIDENIIELAKKFLYEYPEGVKGNFEAEFIRKDGARIFTSIAATPMKNYCGSVTGTLALVGDITVRKHMETKLEEYSKQLEVIVDKKTKELAQTQIQLIKSERLAAIGELAAMIGHDLRNPLSAIRNANYFLKNRNNELNPSSAVMLDIIDKCIDRSNKIINDLLDYSKEIKLQIQETSTKNLVNEALSELIIPTDVKLIINVEEEIIIFVDEQRLIRVISNIIKNAVEALPTGGTITLDSNCDNESFEVSITDTGVGIPEEALPKLFQPLFTTKAQGMGFGLAICKRIVEAHGGTITAKSTQGEGTKFTIKLPRNNKSEVI